VILLGKNNDYISINEAAEYLGVTRLTIYRWRKAKPPKIKVYKKGNQLLVKKSDIEEIKADRERIKPLDE
jgi:excisionase family DNA binding protein